MKVIIEKAIMDRIQQPGWVTTRGILRDPAGEAAEEEHREVEEVMRDLARRGLIKLWRLNIKDQGEVIMAAARPDLELDRDLEQRGAWAVAEPMDLDQ